MTWISGVAIFILGWLAKQIDQWLSDRRDRRRRLGRVLCDLLEIRHHVLIVPLAVKALADRLSIPAGTQFAAQVVLQTFLPADSFRGYEESVALLAESDPVEAFRLRSKDLAPAILSRMRQIALADTSSHVAWQRVERLFISSMKSHFDQVAVEVAELRGWRTKRQVEDAFQKQLELPSGLIDSFLNEVAEQARRQATQTGQP